MTAFVDSLIHQGVLFNAALALSALAGVVYTLVTFGKGGRAARTSASVLSAAAFITLTVLIGQRWLEAGRPPFKTLYESLLLFAWCTAFLHVAVERFYRIAWVGVSAAAFVVGALFYATVKADIEVVNLPAALQSVWFVPHVVVYFIGYGALFFAFVAAVLHLLRPQHLLQVRSYDGTVHELSYAGFMHLAILFGFVLLTAGLVIGAIWAKQAWGDYWVWDPKESWALISWLVFLIYLHQKRVKGFTERKGAVLTIFGFVTIVFTYLGMHLLPTAAQSAHVYQ